MLWNNEDPPRRKCLRVGARPRRQARAIGKRTLTRGLDGLGDLLSVTGGSLRYRRQLFHGRDRPAVGGSPLVARAHGDQLASVSQRFGQTAGGRHLAAGEQRADPYVPQEQDSSPALPRSAGSAAGGHHPRSDHRRPRTLPRRRAEGRDPTHAEPRSAITVSMGLARFAPTTPRPPGHHTRTWRSSEPGGAARLSLRLYRATRGTRTPHPPATASVGTWCPSSCRVRRPAPL